MAVSLLLLLSSSLLVSGTLSAEVNPCAPKWNYYNETGCCYKTTSDVGTWFQGSEMCASMRMGSQLASLRSEGESKFVAARYKNGIDGIHAWTGLSQTKVPNNWTFTDGSEPWYSFFGPFYLLQNHTSCVEIVDNWLVELFQNSGKTQPTFCYHLLQSLCKYCPVPVATTAKQVVVNSTTTSSPPHQSKIVRAHPKSLGTTSATGGTPKPVATNTNVATSTTKSAEVRFARAESRVTVTPSTSSSQPLTPKSTRPNGSAATGRTTSVEKSSDESEH